MGAWRACCGVVSVPSRDAWEAEGLLLFGLVLAGIPRLSDANEPAARRFMWLVDALYDRQRFLIASAADEIGGLYDGHQFAFEFARPRSRLGEMTRRTAAGRPIDE